MDGELFLCMLKIILKKLRCLFDSSLPQKVEPVIERIPCRECGNMILPATAEHTGGLCMPCKQGFRKNLEDSKIRREEKKKWEASPVGEHWKWLLNQPYESLSRENQLFRAVHFFLGHVIGDGLEAYFYEQTRLGYLDTIEGLAAIGDTETLRILKEAKEVIYGEDDVPGELSVCQNIMSEKMFRHQLDALEKELEKEWDKESAQIDDFLMAYAEKHKLCDGFGNAREN